MKALELAPLEPPEWLYYGTGIRFSESIRKQGLRPGRRNHVRLSSDPATATKVGQQHGRPLVLTVSAGKMHSAGFPFYRSADGIWLTARVPVEYLAFPDWMPDTLAIRDCPLQDDWRSWDLFAEATRFNRLANPVDMDISLKARAAKRGRQLRHIEAKWEIAPDDAAFQPPPEGTSFHPGYPSHEHTEFEVDGQRVHIDRMHAIKGGPGRFYTEFRIFISGKFAGRGGGAGTSLGGGGSDLFATALVGDKVLTASDSGIILWERLDPVL